MNKKLIGNLFLLALVITLGLSFVDFGKSKHSHEDLISDFITENLDPETRYRPIVFKRIDESMLMSQPSIEEAFATISDSISLQLGMLSHDYLSLDFQNSLQAAKDYQQGLKLESITGYLSLDAKLKRALNKAGGLSGNLQELLHHEESRMHQAIGDLNAALSQYNLSLFSLNFGKDASPLYWHEYELSDEMGSNVQQAVFELEKESGTVLSFKEVENVG